MPRECPGPCRLCLEPVADWPSIRSYPQCHHVSDLVARSRRVLTRLLLCTRIRNSPNRVNTRRERASSKRVSLTAREGLELDGTSPVEQGRERATFKMALIL